MVVDPDDPLAWFGGTTVNDLKNVLNISEEQDPDNDIPTSSLTRFIELNKLEKYLKDHKHGFIILSLNVQTIRAKFDHLFAVLCSPYDEGLYNLRLLGLLKMMASLCFFHLVIVQPTRVNHT